MQRRPPAFPSSSLRTYHCKRQSLFSPFHLGGPCDLLGLVGGSRREFPVEFLRCLVAFAFTLSEANHLVKKSSGEISWGENGTPSRSGSGHMPLRESGFFLGEVAQWVSIVSLLETVLRKAKLESYRDNHHLVVYF